jgi:bla regulator protein blaR1
MLGALTNHAWQSTFFALAAALLTLAFRKNRAQVRYWIWLGASLKFLVPFALLISLGASLWNLVPVRNAAQQIGAPTVAQTIVQITQPVPDTLSFAPAGQRATNWLFLGFIAFWGCGFLAIAVMRLRAWLRVRGALRCSTRIEIAVPVEVRSAPGLLEPGVVGIFGPTLLLPEDILESLTPPQLEAVLAHELAHVRRRDNLTAALHMLVEAVFWFHPLVWWIGTRLIDERERACDEAVLSLGNQPRVYAEAILQVCKFYIESPLVCVSGVTGASLKKRIHAILAIRIATKLSLARKSLLILAGALALALPLLIGIIEAPLLRAQSASADKPKFEVASVKPCVAGDVGFAGRAGWNPGPQWSPGRLIVTCQPAWFFITRAYIVYADGQEHRFAMVDITTPVEGAPSWLKSERFTISAEVPGNASQEMMMGPMMQSLLEDRFRLKLHIESKEVPAY